MSENGSPIPSSESNSTKKINDARRTMPYCANRNLGSHEDNLFTELQKVLKATVDKLNEQLPGAGAGKKRYDIKTTYKFIELIGPHELSFDIEHDADTHQLTLAL